MRLYHGGVSGLKPGQLLLPPCETGHVPARLTTGKLFDGESVEDYLGPDINRGDRVYLTPDREFARAYAAMIGVMSGSGYGSLYVAEPVGPAEPDPDIPQASVQCARAVIRSVYDPVVTMGFDQIVRRVSRYISLNPVMVSDP